jgi:hypothetical protein
MRKNKIPQGKKRCSMQSDSALAFSKLKFRAAKMISIFKIKNSHLSFVKKNLPLVFSN